MHRSIMCPIQKNLYLIYMLEGARISGLYPNDDKIHQTIMFDLFLGFLWSQICILISLWCGSGITLLPALDLVRFWWCPGSAAACWLLLLLLDSPGSFLILLHLSCIYVTIVYSLTSALLCWDFWLLLVRDLFELVTCKMRLGWGLALTVLD